MESTMDRKEHDRHERRLLGEAFSSVDPVFEEKQDRDLRAEQVMYGSREVEERESRGRVESPYCVGFVQLTARLML